MLSVFWAVENTVGAEVRLNQISSTQVEVTGGNDKAAWRLRYGTGLRSRSFKPHFVASEGNRAWYSYGGWLRLIDTQKGVVIGRWHFPDEIVGLAPHDTKVEVELGDRGSDFNFNRKFELNPSAPHVPYWPTNYLVLYRIPMYEAQYLWGSVIQGGHPSPSGIHEGHSRPKNLPTEERKKVLPELEEAVRRDPLTPWFRIGLGTVLRDIGDPRATQVIEEAIKTPTTDFTELWPISAYLDSLGEHDLARAAFERGYQDFWQRGNDPRMFTVLIGRLVILGAGRVDWGNSTTPLSREMIERIYRVTPYAEGASYAWHLYADYLTAHGSADEARLWRARAEDALQNGGTTFFGDKTSIRTDPLILLALGSAVGAILYAFVLFARYQPQRRLDNAARKRTVGITRGFAFFNTEYWSRRERVAFFTVILLGWFSVGLVGEHLTSILRRAAMPISAVAGSFAGPVTIAKFENGLPATPQRDLMMAVAYQQDGQVERAEHLYRSLPQFAESWNNLGVILKQKENDQEAQAAFEKALQLDPKLAEAALNMGRPPSDFWTEQHQKYLPSQPMIAPPRDITTALMGGSPSRIFLCALAGPFAGDRPLGSSIRLILWLIG